MQLTQALHRSIQTRGRRTATIYGTRERTWQQVGDRVARAAAALHALGLQRGDRVAVLAHNSDNYLELFFCVAWAGLVLVPLNTRWAVPENVYALRDSGARALFVDDAFADQAVLLTAACPVPNLVHFGEAATPAGMHAYEVLIATSEPAEDRCASDDDLYAIFYTGGTTGVAKGVMLSHKNFVFSSINWIGSLHLDEDTRYMHVAGFFHLAGASPALAVSFAAGSHVCVPKFEPVTAFQAIQTHKVNYCLLVPTMVNAMINHPDIRAYDLSSVRYCEYGSSSMPDAVLMQAARELPSWEFIQGYGMTECTTLATTLPWKYHFDGPHGASKRLSAGRAAYGIDVKIVDEAGVELPRGVPGEIAVRGAQTMLGYWNKPEATAAAIRDGWLHTGDGAYMDEEGFVYIVDRVKDMIISGAENIYSREVENAVHQHPAVRECAVIGIPSDKWGETVHAVVVRRPGFDLAEAELIAHCRSLIAGYKCPRSVEFRDALPLSGAGKIMKNVLREPHWEGRSKAVN